MLAPAFSRTWTAFVCPDRAAVCIGVSPSRVRASSWAPLSISSWAISDLPQVVAKCRGVMLSYSESKQTNKVVKTEWLIGLLGSIRLPPWRPGPPLDTFFVSAMHWMQSQTVLGKRMMAFLPVWIQWPPNANLFYADKYMIFDRGYGDPDNSVNACMHLLNEDKCYNSRVKCTIYHLLSWILD